MRIKIVYLFFILSIAFLGAPRAYSQTIRYVDNNLGRTANTAAFVYTSIQAAHDAAAPNDIIYVIGSPIEYVSPVMTKPLHIIGPGYLLGNNPQTQASNFSASASVSSNVIFTFNAGSAGSIVEGLKMSRMLISTNNITVRRNQFNNVVTLDVNVSGINIVQNFLQSVNVGAGDFNVLIANNLVTSGIGANSASAYNINISNNTVLAGGISCNQPTTTVTITNNLIIGAVNLNGAVVFSNNIIQTGAITNSNGASVSGVNNIANTGIVYPGAPSGITGTNASVTNAVLFSTASPSNAIDNNWLLTASNPAIGAGTGGTDIGFTGGVTPYVLSGLPPVPSVYNFLSPGSGSTTLPNVQVQIKSNN